MSLKQQQRQSHSYISNVKTTTGVAILLRTRISFLSCVFSTFIIADYVENNVVLLNVGVVQEVESVICHMFINRTSVHISAQNKTISFMSFFILSLEQSKCLCFSAGPVKRVERCRTQRS